MNFSEKLMNLRKKAGLSQEELGNKLNVSRQTVSKWELGVTTPDMEKIKEMSILFNVTVDELVNGTISDNISKIETTKEISKENKPKKGREKTVLGILVTVLIICIGILLYFGITGHKNNQSEKKGFFDRFFGIFDNVSNGFESDFEYNKLEMFYKGSQLLSSTISCLDDVINLNSKGDNITVSYEGKDYSNDEIEEIKNLLKSNSHYNITFDYDGKKIIKVKIKREFTKEDADHHNNLFEFFYTGTIRGSSLKSAFDEIIKINQENVKIITLNFLGKDYVEASEIRKLKSKLGTFDEYEVYYEKDEQGFINKAIVEEVR